MIGAKGERGMQKKDRLAWKLHNQATKDQFSTKQVQLGPWTSYSMIHDPKHMCFVLSRYKFCSKMLKDKKRVLEIGCGDGFGIPIMAQAVGHLHCIDWEPRNIKGNAQRYPFIKNVSYQCLDASRETIDGQYDACFHIDVLEHLEPKQEKGFMENTCKALVDAGVLVVGTPNKAAARYATKRSSSQHINLKTEESLRCLVQKYFKNCFIFSMNDEVVHTGYSKMAHYLFAIGVGKK